MWHAAVASWVLMLAACAPQHRQPLWETADLAQRNIAAMTLAPVVDDRAFPETRVPIASYVREAAGRALDRKGYQLALTTDPDVVRLRGPLVDSSGEALVAQFGADAPYVLWIGVEQVETESTGIGLDTRVRVTGSLVETATQAVVWRDRAERESSVSGAGVATGSPSARTYQAVYRAVTTLLDSLPDHAR